MPREEFPCHRLRLGARKRYGESDSDRSTEIKKGSPLPEEKEAAIRIKGEAIEPRWLFQCELIIVLGSEKRQPYYSPLHNRNS